MRSGSKDGSASGAMDKAQVAGDAGGTGTPQAQPGPVAAQEAEPLAWRARAGKRASEEVVGRVRVRCVSASNLAAGKMRLFPWQTPDPFAVLQLQDPQSKQQSPLRYTRCLPKSLNPRWREDFWFSVRKRPSSLLLHVEVWHHNEPGTGDDFLGQANLPLSEHLLLDTTQQRQTYDLPLQPDLERGSQDAVSGSIKLEIAWEPSIMGNREMNTRTAIREVCRMPQVMQVTRVGLLGTSVGVLLVASNARWLCRGASLAGCTAVQVPGTETCAYLAAMCAFTVTSVHFAGSIGLLGSGWSGAPLGLIDLLEMEEDGQDPGEASHGEDTARMNVKSLGMLQWSISVATSIMPKISLTAIRLFSLLVYLASMGLCGLGLLLAWLEEGPSMVFGEAVYLDAGALICLTAGIVTSVRERMLLAQAEREKWGCMGRPAEPAVPLYPGALAPQLKLQELASSAKQGMDRLRGQAGQAAEQLTQPLLGVQQRFEEEVAKPIRQRLQESLDHSSATPEWMQPLLDALNATAPQSARRHAGEPSQVPPVSSESSVAYRDMHVASSRPALVEPLPPGPGGRRLPADEGLQCIEVKDTPIIESKSVCCRC